MEGLVVRMLVNPLRLHLRIVEVLALRRGGIHEIRQSNLHVPGIGVVLNPIFLMPSYQPIKDFYLLLVLLSWPQWSDVGR